MVHLNSGIPLHPRPLRRHRSNPTIRIPLSFPRCRDPGCVNPSVAQRVDVPTVEIETARLALARASRVMVLTGAGVSTASGIPDYRGPRGVWTLDPTAERASRADVYARDRKVREASWRRLLARAENSPQPNAAHHCLSQFESTGRLSLLVTQNIDGLHLAAGTSAERLIEIHGHVRSVRCLTCAAPIDQCGARSCRRGRR